MEMNQENLERAFSGHPKSKGRQTFFICLFLLIASWPNTLSQPLPVTTNYIISKYSISPANAGLHNNFKAVMTHRQNWMGIQGAPQSTMLFMDGAAFENVGYGLRFVSEKTGVFKDMGIGGSYAYHLFLERDHFLSFGLSLEYYRNEMDFNNIRIIHEGDPIINRNQYSSASSINGSLGASYQLNGLNTGIVVNNLMARELVNNGITYPAIRQYKLYGSYRYDIQRPHAIEPILIVYKNSGQTIDFDAGAVYSYNNLLWGGLVYRNGMNISFLSGLNLYESFVLNYSYEFSTRDLTGASAGSHEISLGFYIDKDEKFGSGYLKAKRKHFLDKIMSIFKR
jgi:type IX secretion system PorP/SprF family membrane protein